MTHRRRIRADGLGGRIVAAERGRRGQVVKAELCKSSIPSSILGVASSLCFRLCQEDLDAWA